MALVWQSQAARGNTYQKLVSELEIQKIKAKEAKQISKYYKALKKDAGSSNIKLFNKIFVQRCNKLNPDFKKVSKEKFKAGIKKVNFYDESSRGFPGWPAANTINPYVLKKANKTLIDAVDMIGDNYSKDTRAVLVHGVYFTANWTRQFDPSKSYKGSYADLPHDYMTTLDTFNYAQLPDLNATAVEMEYENSNFTLVIVLPSNPVYNAMEILVRDLQDYDWSKITKNMEPKYMNLTLPKMPYSSVQSFPLNATFNSVCIPFYLLTNSYC